MARKFTIIICDDEERIIKLIQALIPWDTMDLEIVGTASNGQEAETLIREKSPDIAITDIRMPGKDGLDLVKEATAFSPGTHFIIISGYRQFDYARTAISYGVQDYLLKPIDKDELTATIEKIKSRILNEEGRDQKIRDAESVSEGLLLRKALAGGLQYETKRASLLCCIKTDFEEDEIPEGMLSVLQEKILLTARQTDGVLAASAEDDLSFLLADISEHGKDSFISDLKFNLKKAETLHSALHLPIFMISTEGYLKAAHDTIMDALDLRFDSDTVDLDKRPPSRKGICASIWENISLRLASSLSAEEAEIACTRFMKEAENGYALTSSVLWALRRLSVHLEHQGSDCSAWYSSAERIIRLSPDKAALEKRFVSSTVSLLSQIASDKEKEESRPIREADRYMNDHYMDAEISLERVAEHVGLSSAYFSEFYKKSKGVGFQDMLTQIRLEKAKELLVNTSDPVYRIGNSVGYTDIKYFSKLFRKTYGIKPNEFRKLYS